MVPAVVEDPILRENWRFELTRRLISHGVRTELIERLTGLTRNRQFTMRKRLNVPSKSRLRGPTRTSLELFLKTPRAQAEGAALVTLCFIFEIPVDRDAVAVPDRVSLNFTSKLCETYEAYRALFPSTKIELEELILLRNSFVAGDIRLGRCRTCRGLLLTDSYQLGNRLCAACTRSDR